MDIDNPSMELMQGSLVVSRAIWDKHLGRWVITEPETKTIEIRPGCEFLILASDGIWDTAKLATQFRCSRQKKMATKPNCGQQQQVEADGKQICTLHKDSAERLDDNNAQATP
ncbi:probable protein phosphatase 2C 25 [Tanacetum coccineum]